MVTDDEKGLNESCVAGHDVAMFVWTSCLDSTGFDDVEQRRVSAVMPQKNISHDVCAEACP